MGKAFGLAVIVLGIYVGLELYTEGTQRAFGGLLVQVGMADAPAPDEAPEASPLEAIRSRAGEDAAQAASRGEGQLDSAPE